MQQVVYWDVIGFTCSVQNPAAGCYDGDTEFSRSTSRHFLNSCSPVTVYRTLCQAVKIFQFFPLFFYFGATALFRRFLDHTQRRTTVGRTPLDEWSARRRDLYLTTHNTHNKQISMPPVGFEPTISAGERPQTYALDRAATGTGFFCLLHLLIYD